jgi:hypothetical protein
MSAVAKNKPSRRLGTDKVTSIGGRAKPTNKSKRRSHKAYRGQGRP